MSSRTLRFVLTVLVLVLVDQATKTIAYHLEFEHNSVIPIGNPETALGLISGSRRMLVALTAGGVLLFGLYLMRRVRNGLPPWIAGLLIAGAMSNLIDRLFVGYVRDFIALPGVIVNLADVFLVAGTIALLFVDHRLSRAPRTSGSTVPCTGAETVAAS